MTIEKNSTTMPRPSMEPSKSHERLIVVGAGLVGSLLSIFLARRGFSVDVYDKNGDPREVDLSAHRSSMNLSLSERGLAALDLVGMGDRIRGITVPTYGRLIHDTDGSLRYQNYGTKNESRATYTVMRNDLNKVLLDAAVNEFGVRCHFNEKCLDLDLETNTLSLEDRRTGLVHHERASRIFGADGAYSSVRNRLQRVRPFDFRQQYLDHGYKEVNVPASADCGWTERTDAVHLWPRGKYMMLGLPKPDGSFACSLKLPLSGDPSFATIDTPEELRAFFESSFGDVKVDMAQLVEEAFDRPVNYYISVRCWPWSYRDQVALIGDSAHAIFPFYAQGTNCGFEDCLELDRCLDEWGDDWERVFRLYEERRKPNADAISDMSREHYLELRDRVGQPGFQLRKKIEARLATWDEERFKSQYTMVTFTSVPYAEARQRGQELDRFIDQLLEIDDIEQHLQGDFESMVERLLAQSAILV